jgi:hypothetical protein
MSMEDLHVLYEAVNIKASFEEFVWFVGEETDVQTILSWFKDTTVH